MRKMNHWGWLFIAASLLAFATAIYDYFFAWGINGSLGALIVLTSTAIMAATALELVFGDPRGWARVVLGIGLVLGFLGTALAAYFLESYILVAFDVIAAIGWLAFVVAPAASRAEQPA